MVPYSAGQCSFGIAGLYSSYASASQGGSAIEEQQSYILNGQYQVGSWVFKAQYGYSESSHGQGIDDTEISMVALGADYKLSKTVKVYGYFATMGGDNPSLFGDSDGETVGVGCSIAF